MGLACEIHTHTYASLGRGRKEEGMRREKEGEEGGGGRRREKRERREEEEGISKEEKVIVRHTHSPYTHTYTSLVV